MADPKAQITLRPLRPDDAAVLAGWAGDPEFCRAAEWTVDRPVADVREFHRVLIESPPGDLIRLGAVHDGELVGYVDLHGDEPHRRELGYVIGERSRWGQGLGLAAAAAGLRHGFEQLGLDEIWAEARSTNERSLRILRRLGMQETAGDGAHRHFVIRKQ